MRFGPLWLSSHGGKNNIRWKTQIRNFPICIFLFAFPLSLVVQNILPSGSSETPQIYFLHLEQEAEFYTSISSYQCKLEADVFHSISPIWLPCTFILEYHTENVTRKYANAKKLNGRSQLPRSQRCRSAAACLLRLWVWIPPGGLDVCLLWMLFCQAEFFATSWSLVQRSPTDCSASLCVF